MELFLLKDEESHRTTNTRFDSWDSTLTHKFSFFADKRTQQVIDASDGKLAEKEQTLAKDNIEFVDILVEHPCDDNVNDKILVKPIIPRHGLIQHEPVPILDESDEEELSNNVHQT